MRSPAFRLFLTSESCCYVLLVARRSTEWGRAQPEGRVGWKTFEVGSDRHRKKDQTTTCNYQSRLLTGEGADTRTGEVEVEVELQQRSISLFQLLGGSCLCSGARICDSLLTTEQLR